MWVEGKWGAEVPEPCKDFGFVLNEMRSTEGLEQGDMWSKAGVEQVHWLISLD